MSTVIDLTETRRIKQERCTLYSDAARDLMRVVETYRHKLDKKYMAFLFAMALADLAMRYSGAQQQTGQAFLDEVMTTVRQLHGAN